jgi:hypothetical protein
MASMDNDFEAAMEDSDDEIDWEEVPVPDQEREEHKHLDITVTLKPKQSETPNKYATFISNEDAF